jgi:uncharacterized protein (UPF0332 family)
MDISLATLIQSNKLKSQRSYVDALKAFQKGTYDISLIKAYSAVFSAAEAILLAHNYIAPSKRDMLNRFGHLRAMEPVMEKYRRMEVVSKEEARRVLDANEWFIEVLKRM